MQYNITELLSLPDDEKLSIINALIESIDAKEGKPEWQSEEDFILNERMEEYNSGKMKFDSWENVQKRLKEKALQRLNNNDGKAA
jgi:putative addiction module component (TIGR02574 family)